MTEQSLKRGRPPLADEAGERFEIRLPAALAAQLRAAGAGSLSRGIMRAAQGLAPLGSPPPTQAQERARARAVRLTRQLARALDEVGPHTEGRP